jgi:DNA-binding beta-propeller fold protein YncE
VAHLSPGTFAYRLTFTHDGRHVLVPRFSERGVAVYDARARQQIRTLPVPGRPLSILVSPDSRFAYVAMIDPDLILKIDLTTGEAVGSASASPVPDGLALARDPFPPPVHRRRSARSG